jgi:leucyl-tRNA synthetase
MNFSKLEEKWQDLWRKLEIDRADINSSRKKFYNLMMFPYPSAEGLHVGNMYAFTGSDIYGRFKRMQGYNVLEPIGLDGFGIHSENYCIKIGRHPMEHARITEKNFYAQLRKIGAMFDWSRTVETYKPAYYKYTQWLFVELFKAGLAYRAKAQVNWCPSCKTVLADEQVLNGVCERCGNAVLKKFLNQWFFRITAYAEKLDSHIPSLVWTEKVKVAQRNWIGKKEGIEIEYKIVDENDKVLDTIVCFTTRPETNFGATFVVIAPEHPFITRLDRLIDNKQLDRVRKYVENVAKISTQERIAKSREKTGVFTGLYAINSLTNYKMPVYISDFVLMNFGTGAVVGVPGHDRRDFEFAKTFNLPVIRVVSQGEKLGPIKLLEDVHEGEGTMVASEFLNGLDIEKAKEVMMDHIVKQGWGKKVTVYHLRDWLISRQRYWGAPIPMIYCEHCAREGKSYFTSDNIEGNRLLYSDIKVLAKDMKGWYPVPEKDLPVELPFIEDFKPGNDGIAPLKKHKEFYETKCPSCDKPAVRETDVSDTFLDSSWYFLRYPSVGCASSDEVSFDPEITKNWLPVDMYTGGAEHSVLHLMYSRFITMALHDMGYLDFDEPFTNFFAHGLVIKDGAKMSKSKGNVINPDEYIRLYGSDALRLYLMFMGPYSEGGDFRDSAMEGMSRWVGRVWRMIQTIGEKSKKEKENRNERMIKSLHRLIKKVGEDIERRQYNTAIAAMMEFTNLVAEHNFELSREDAKTFLTLLAPFAPHVTEELYQSIEGRETIQEKSQSIHLQRWPSYDENQLLEDMIQIVIQVNGKVRDNISIATSDASNKQKVEKLAKAREKVKPYISSPVKNVIFLPGRLMNFVV